MNALDPTARVATCVVGEQPVPEHRSTAYPVSSPALSTHASVMAVPEVAEAVRLLGAAGRAGVVPNVVGDVHAEAPFAFTARTR